MTREYAKPGDVIRRTRGPAHILGAYIGEARFLRRDVIYIGLCGVTVKSATTARRPKVTGPPTCFFCIVKDLTHG